MPAQNKTGAETIRWDLTDLYTGVSDPKLMQDVTLITRTAADFSESFKGKLSQKLGEALSAYRELDKLSNRIFVYIFLNQSCDGANQTIQQVMAKAQEAWAVASANHLTFFEHELAAIDEKTYQNLLLTDKVVKHHQPMLDHLRAQAKYLLSEDVERALTLRAPFGPSEWGNYFDEVEAEVTFKLGGKKMNISEILHILSESTDREERAEALKVTNQGIKDHMAKVMARALNATIGHKNIEDAERGYENTMTSRNIGNKVPDAVVEALHTAVNTAGARQARRYYRLLAAHLGYDKLKWSDRNAKPFKDSDAQISWHDCLNIVTEAYGSFSPKLAGLIQHMIDNKWVDAPTYKGKTGGAYNYSVELPEGVRTYTFLNYLGSTRDVMTVAHEFGHGVHGMLAGEKQGSLMMQAPMAYAETASIFGEMVTFNYLLGRSKSDREKLALVMGKTGDFLNSVCRQISFSSFEQRIHTARKEGKLTVEDFNGHWMSVTETMYGADGDVFTYQDMDHMWGYVSHFLRPFYVYAYAFGELLTQSLFAVKDQFGDDFEPLYLDLLRAGGTKDAIELLKPFGLDPTDPAFWTKGIEASIGTWLDEAERLSSTLGVKAA
jgi:oligoendopeptidase F